MRSFANSLLQRSTNSTPQSAWLTKQLEEKYFSKLPIVNSAASISSTKKSKYKAKRILIDGIWFHSKREGSRYLVLKQLEKIGLIRNLRLQVPYLIEINGIKICKYNADFVYFDVAKGVEVVEDSKGYQTKDYKLKKKMVEAAYSIRILET